jgi:hypothetical protein
MDSKARRLVHPTKDTRLANIRHVDEDIVRRVTVQRGAEPLLVEMVTNEPNAPPKHKQAVQSTDLDVLIRLLGSERARVPQEVDEADSNAPVDVEDEGILLGGGDLLDGEGVVEEGVRGEVLADVLLDELDTEIGVVDALDLVADTSD